MPRQSEKKVTKKYFELIPCDSIAEDLQDCDEPIECSVIKEGHDGILFIDAGESGQWKLPLNRNLTNHLLGKADFFNRGNSRNKTCKEV